MFINIKTWVIRKRNSRLRSSIATWSCMTASAASAAAFCSFYSATIAVACSGLRRSKAPSDEPSWSEAAGILPN
jgi:hypothetical protein